MPSRFQPIKLLLQKGQLHKAASELQKIQLDQLQQPDVRDFYYLCAITYRYLGEYVQAEQSVNQLLKLFPKYEMAWQERGHIKLSQGQVSEAAKAFKQAVSLNWALKSSWQALKTLCLEQGNAQESDWCEMFMSLLEQLDRRFSQWLFDSFTDEAEAQLPTMLAFSREHRLSVAENLVVATCLFKAERFGLAETILRKLLPADNLLVHYLLANVLARKQDFHGSLDLAQVLIERFPEVIQVQFLFANQLMATDQFALANEYYQRIAAVEPNFEQVWLNLGHMAKTQGNTAAAIDSYQSALKVRHNSGDAYWSLANLKSFNFDEAQLAEMQSVVQEDLADEDKAPLCFALGYAFERHGEYQKSFEFYLKGNDLKNKKVSYTRTFLDKEFNCSVKVNWPKLNAKADRVSTLANAPIFVLGMPRAGSTLLEQILAAHSQISATYELPHILSIAKQLNHNAAEKGESFYASTIDELDELEFAELKRYYLDKVAPLNINTRYFIDKMPNNFRHVGLIKLLFPNAKIIDIRRDKMACCFSNFKQHYGQGQEFSYNWKNLTHYYDKYVELMTYWRQIYTDEICYIEYESLVRYPEMELKRVLEYLELDFESSCLQHQVSVGKVKTASAEQVREAINERGLNYWRNYESFLKDL